MIKWQVSFEEKINEHQEVMERLLPLKLMQLKSEDLNKQFVIKPGNDEYTSRELVFKFYENTNCKIIYLTGDHSVASIVDLVLELPPVFIFHADLSLTREKFDDLSKLNVLNAIYATSIHGQTNLFWHNFYKVIEADLQFYWRN
jgi:hypothetical protein